MSNETAKCNDQPASERSCPAPAGSGFAMTNEELQSAIEKTREMEKNCCKNVTKEKLSAHLYDLLKVQKARAVFLSFPQNAEVRHGGPDGNE